MSVYHTNEVIESNVPLGGQLSVLPPYLERSHIKVYEGVTLLVDGVDYEWTTSQSLTALRGLTAPIRILRETPGESLLSGSEPMSYFDPEAMLVSQKQAFYLAQELEDDAATAVADAELSATAAQGSADDAYASEVQAGLDAAAAADSEANALASKNTAAGHASDALGYSNTAASHASTAAGHAATALGHAEDAEDSADDAAASAAQALLNVTAPRDQVGSWTACQYFPETTLTITLEDLEYKVSPNLSVNQSAYVLLTQDITIKLPTNLVSGAVMMLRLKQDATGGRTVSYAAGFDFGDQPVPEMPIAAGSEMILSLYTDGTKAYITQFWRD